MSDKYLDLAQQLVETALRHGAEEAETYINMSQELDIEVNNQQVETMKVSQDKGIGLRVIKEGRLGFVYSSDFSPERIEGVVKQAIANGEKTTSDKYNRLPVNIGKLKELEFNNQTLENVSVEDKIQLAKRIEQAAKGYDKRVKNTRTSSYQEAKYTVCLANSNGIASTYTGSYCGGYSYLVAEQDGESQTGFGLQYSLNYHEIDPEKIGQQAAKKAVQMLGAITINTQKANIILDPYIATNFLGLIGPALTGEAVLKGKSLFANKKGQKVAADEVCIIDDGCKIGGIMSAPFDGEGVPTSKTTLIQDGALKGFLHNTYTAANMGEQSTGNAVRNSFKSTPEVGTTNFYINSGKTSRKKLIDEVNKGFYITEVMGMHTANPISGDFSLGAAGIWIENGEFTKPVRGVAIAGNILELLQAVEVVGDDLTFFVGKGSPTLRIGEMVISG